MKHYEESSVDLNSKARLTPKDFFTTNEKSFGNSQKLDELSQPNIISSTAKKVFSRKVVESC